MRSERISRGTGGFSVLSGQYHAAPGDFEDRKASLQARLQRAGNPERGCEDLSKSGGQLNTELESTFEPGSGQLVRYLLVEAARPAGLARPQSTVTSRVQTGMTTNKADSVETSPTLERWPWF